MRTTVCQVMVLVFVAACGGATHEATGRVEAVHRDLGLLIIAHDDIDGLMPAMTMNFDVASPELLDGLAPGDRVRFEVAGADSNFRIVAIERVAVAAPEAGVRRLADIVSDDDAAPDFTLVDQDGNERSLQSLRGKFVLLDFVYTHCPGPCPVLTSTHVQVQQRLPAALHGRIWFASISLDPARDTPQAMREYGLARGADLATWWFLTGPAETIEQVLEGYGVGSVPANDGAIQHIVVTFLIDDQGRILKRYFGLDHDVDELLRDLRREASV